MPSINSLIVSPALSSVQEQLFGLVHTPQGTETLQAAFGTSFEREAAILWLNNVVNHNVSDFPELEIISSAEINHADGAYSAETNTIYLATEFVVANSANSPAISDVILEEFGHFLDSKFNSLDTPGDEGELFASLVQNKHLTEQQLKRIQNENDQQTVLINNQTIQIEQAKPGVNPAFDLIGLTQLRNDPQFAGIDGSGLSIVVIDTGIDKEHPLIAPNYRTGYDFVDDDNDPSDFDGHGTHVSGIIGATNETIGVAPDVGLISLRVFNDNDGSFFTRLENSLEWVLANKEAYNITAVNLSLGIGFFTPESILLGDNISDDIKRLEEAGVTVISGTGNSYFANSGKPNQANITFPAIASTIAVGAVWQDGTQSNAVWQSGSIDYTTGADRIVSFSQRLDAPNVIFAPGAIITSTVPGGGIGARAGTSQAAPHVAGAVALLQEASLQFSGHLLTPEEVNEILRSTGDSIIDGDDEDDNVSNTNDSYLRINLYNAVSEVKRRSDSIAVPVENNPDDISGELSLSNSDPNALLIDTEDVNPSSDIDVFSDNKIHRFFSPEAGVHFYTASEAERDFLVNNQANYSYEGASFASATENADAFKETKPVYRFFNTSTGGHLYTMSEVERDNISNNLANYNFEGIAYYGYESDRPGATPLYRFYNPIIDAHFYTPSAVEKDVVLANVPDYQLESNDGVAFYVEPLAEI